MRHINKKEHKTVSAFYYYCYQCNWGLSNVAPSWWWVGGCDLRAVLMLLLLKMVVIGNEEKEDRRCKYYSR